MSHLNEAAMLVDGYLAGSGRPGKLAARMHRLIFDTELAAHARGRTVIQLRRQPLPDEVRALMPAALADLDRGGHPEVVAASCAAIRAARAEGTPAGVMGPTARLPDWVAAGVSFYAVTSDVALLANAATEQLHQLRAATAAPEPEGAATAV
ncbi:hypothetical protein [Streptomyces sp. NPDC005507]|uniref:hypothetical protein n=1 Tax=unclassified Streptomyces TaxID=2593676 RepID=UPI0033A2671A